MADFYSVLTNSLRKRDIADPVARERVYLRARMALIRKLWGQRPRMSDREIEDEVAVFDLAVGFVESDIAGSLPTQRREGRPRAAMRLGKAAKHAWERQVPEIRFDLTEHEVEAEADPEEADRLAYRTHLKEAASRTNQWTETMVRRIDPVAVGAMALAGAAARRTLGHVGAAVAGPAIHETVLVEPIINMAAERTMPTGPGRRTFRSFFPQRSERRAAIHAGVSDGEPGRLQQLFQGVILFFEQLPVRLYEGSVAEHRERRRRLLPRVHIRPPMRPGDAEIFRRRRRRQFVERLAVPLAVIAVVAALAWAGTIFRTEIVETVEELTARQSAVEEVVEIEAKDDDAAAIAALPPAAFVLFDGRDPSVFQAGAGKPVVFESDASGGYVRITASAAGEDGARLVISSGVADRLARRTIRVVVIARAPVTDGAGTIRLGYRAGGEAGPFPAQPLGREFRRLEIEWTVPGGSALGQHALHIEPGLLGGGSSVDVKAVEIFFVP